jgi:dTDP-4-amino-4,6-dideoxygalactose transaminase
LAKTPVFTTSARLLTSGRIRLRTPKPDARHLYTLLLDIARLRVGRDEVQQALHRQSIGIGIHYRALHLHQYYREAFGYTRGDLPNSEWISDRTLSLPLSPKLTEVDVDDVIFAVRQTLRHFA